MEIFRVEKITRINRWLEIIEGEPNTLLWDQFHTKEEAFQLYEYFKNQPERLNPEDKNWFGTKAIVKQDGLCYFEDGTIIDPSQPIDVCDSPNSENK
jgi:hypothetical protein